MFSLPAALARLWIIFVFAPACALAATPPQTEGTTSGQTATILRLTVLRNRTDVEIEIDASQQITPQTRVLTGPDRLVIDFPNAVPGSALRNLSVNRGEVKDVRVGLFEANPPTTRVVLDLRAPQNFHIFPSGNMVIVKLAADAGVNASAPVNPPIQPALYKNQSLRPVLRQTTLGERSAIRRTPALVRNELPVVVNFQNGLLSVRTQKATLAQVLYEIHRQTGADIAVPAGAEQEQVAANLGPAAPKEVLAALLNGSHYNFIILGEDGDAGTLQRVILSPRFGGTDDTAPLASGASAPINEMRNSQPSGSQPDPAVSATPPDYIAPSEGQPPPD
jgi:hypothetical protein